MQSPCCPTELEADRLASLVSKAEALFSDLSRTYKGRPLNRFLYGYFHTRYKLVDEQARFKAWVRNVGAHKTDRSSLEYRLRDASNIRVQVRRLLIELL